MELAALTGGAKSCCVVQIELVAQHRLLCRVMAPPTSSPSTPPPPPPQERDLGDSKKMYCLRVTARGFLSLEPFVVVAAAAPHGLSYDQLLDQLEGVAEPYARFSRCGEGVTEAAQATSGKSSAAAEAPREEETETGDLSDGVSLDSDDFFDGEVPLSPGDKRWSYCLAEAQQRRGPESAVLHYEFAPLLTTQDAERIWGAAGEGKKPVFIRVSLPSTGPVFFATKLGLVC